jgi:ectoine hydroxylase-related dioxygenase (phytanoyl-CoA dioxygenase family)
MSALDRIAADGYVVLGNVLSAAELEGLRRALDRELASERLGRNPFEGFATQRVYTLVAKAPEFAALALHPRILALCDRLLAPNYLLTIAQAIALRPGEVAQPLHNDDAFYAIARPRPAVSVSTIWAIDDFTDENGATEVIPGSHGWDDATIDRLIYRQDFTTRRDPAARREAVRPEDDPVLLARLRRVTMRAGSVLFFLGTLIHRGGANRSDQPRRAITNQYCQPWARQQENYTLAIAPAEAAKLPERLRALLGYSIHPPFMGHVGGMHPARRLPG